MSQNDAAGSAPPAPQVPRPEDAAGAPYLAIAELFWPRVYSMQHRDPYAPTYGCFDRNYWSWKFSDFASARFQEGVYALAHQRRHGSLNSCQDERIFSWALAGFSFWRQLQSPNGSFNEAYPNENSFAATAFTGFYLGQAFLLLEDFFTQEQKSKLRATFFQAGKWLCRNNESHGIISNHLAAAAAALDVIYRICEEEAFHKGCGRLLVSIYQHQSKEGWYQEYEGADPGYQTLTTFYLACLWQSTKDPVLFESLGRSIDFLSYFIHPNGSLGGEYASRNTEFYFPAGFEMLAPVVNNAALIAQFMRSSIAGGATVSLAAVDSINFFPMFNNYLTAGLYAKNFNLIQGSLPCHQEMERYFPQAQLFVKSTPSYYAALALSKGGVVKVYDRLSRRLKFSHCGYWAEVGQKRRVSTQSHGTHAFFSGRSPRFVVKTNFCEIGRIIPSPALFLILRIFTVTLNRIPFCARLLKNTLAWILIKRQHPTTLLFEREIVFEPNNILIADRISHLKQTRVEKLFSHDKFSVIHMGSAKYFQTQEFDSNPLSSSNMASDLMQGQCLERRHQIDFENL